jgi:hypothetical protein
MTQLLCTTSHTKINGVSVTQLQHQQVTQEKFMEEDKDKESPKTSWNDQHWPYIQRINEHAY